MPKRSEPFINESYYHIFNRLLDSRELFRNSKYSSLFFDLLYYYRSTKVTLSFSKFKKSPLRIQTEIKSYLDIKKYHKVEIIAYCLMPTHFHMLIRQKTTGGIIKYISDVINSFTRTYNLEHKRKGPLFLPRFKSVSVMGDDQFIHVSRYIHLNPYSSGLVRRMEDISEYSLSSLKEYTNKSSLCVTGRLLSWFNMDKDKHLKFVLDNADYQKSLEDFKYSDKW